MKPRISFRHTLEEIAVNRNDPCELVRELISNSYDAKASCIILAPLLDKNGVVFFDNGIGISQEPPQNQEISPYEAFFSIGITTKTKGDGIGYKCQGSKLCFAASKFTLITKTKGNENWFIKTITDPSSNIDEDFDINPEAHKNPAQYISKNILKNNEKRQNRLKSFFSEAFFNTHESGTLIIIEQFQCEDYEKYFSTKDADQSYIYNYIRLSTAHGDVRHITAEQGFSAADITTIKSFAQNKSIRAAKLFILKHPDDDTRGDLEKIEIPFGFPYIPAPSAEAEAVKGPREVKRLRDARFTARYATAFQDDSNNCYTMVLAVDGRRRAMEFYTALGWQGKKSCGISLSSQRGTFLASSGLKICSHDEIFESDALRDYAILGENSHQFLLIINGPFDLVTNRNNLAPDAELIAQGVKFISNIKNFLDGVYNQTQSTDTVFRDLIDKLNAERTHYRENEYISHIESTKKGIQERCRFHLTDSKFGPLAGRNFFEPTYGEEHFVGAMYILFSSLIENTHPLITYWPRALTFSGHSIDSVACTEESYDVDNLKPIEYKFEFNSGGEFNHPLSAVKYIVCWDLPNAKIGDVVLDTYNIQGTITDSLKTPEGQLLGYNLGNIIKKSAPGPMGHVIPIVSLKELIKASFAVKFTLIATKK